MKVVETSIGERNNSVKMGNFENTSLPKVGDIFMSSDLLIYSCILCKEYFLSNEKFVEHATCHQMQQTEYEEDINIKKYEETDFTEMNEHDSIEKKTFDIEADILIENDDNFSKEHLVKVINGKTLYECYYCHKQFQSKYSSESHRSIHLGTREFKCPEVSCSKEFRTKKCLHKHMVVHRTDKPYKCEFCSHECKYKGNLREHVRRYHTLEKPFKCQFCEKAFVSGTEKQMHERVHTGEKPFVCELCGKDYKSSTMLNYHLNKHKGIKNYSCTICDKAFFNPSLLWEHSFTHSEEKKITCDVCGQGCKHPKSLRQHKKLHKSKQYVCKICEKAFAQNSGLNFHMKTHQYK